MLHFGTILIFLTLNHVNEFPPTLVALNQIKTLNQVILSIFVFFIIVPTMKHLVVEGQAKFWGHIYVGN